MQHILAVALGGALGSLSRWGLTGLVYRYIGRELPWGTWAVNVLGCFLFGLIWESLSLRLQPSPDVRLFLLTGFLGAFTTFSTFLFESEQILRDGHWGVMALNIGGQVALGFAMLVAGARLARYCAG